MLLFPEEGPGPGKLFPPPAPLLQPPLCAPSAPPAVTLGVMVSAVLEDPLPILGSR